MQVIEEVKAKLAKYPEVRTVEGENSLEILPLNEDGFAISIYENEDQTTVAFGDGWHEEFSAPGEAVNCVGFGLSDQCRLKTFYRGTSPYRWVLEHFEDGQWREDSVTALVFFAFWRRKNVVYRQNNVLV